MPARFLLLSARPETEARDRELASMRLASGLGDRLDTLRVDETDPPDDLFTRYAGVLAGGSPFSITDPEAAKGRAQRRAEATLTRLAGQALEEDRPVFFTCFGIGLLSRVLGAVVDRSHPEPVSAAETRLTEAGATDDVAGVLPARFHALTGHKESAPEVPPGATLLATNETSPVQLYRVGRVLASQFHPEPTTTDFADRARVYADHGYFPVQELATVRADLGRASVTEPRRLLARFVEVHGS